MYPDSNRLSREEALRLYTQGSSWFSNETGRKGAITNGQFADLAVLTDDYMTIADDQIKNFESQLTIVAGKIVYGTAHFANFSPPSLPVLPEWSPIGKFRGYGAPLDVKHAARAGVPVLQHQHTNAYHQQGCAHSGLQLLAAAEAARQRFADFWGLGCDCFAF